MESVGEDRDLRGLLGSRPTQASSLHSGKPVEDRDPRLAEQKGRRVGDPRQW
jgi:hypothetical protein